MARPEKLDKKKIKLLKHYRKKEVSWSSLGKIFDIDPDTAMSYWKKYKDEEIEEDLPEFLLD